MEIMQPNLGGEWEEVRDLAALAAACRERDDDVECCRAAGAAAAGVNFSGLTFRQVVFENCRLAGCDFTGCGFVDVVFRGCDLSGSRFEESYWNRCAWRDTKAVGAACGGSRLGHLQILDSRLQYGVFDRCRLDHLLLERVDCTEASFAACTVKDFFLRDVELAGCSFFQTPLKGVDFTHSQLRGLVLSDGSGELRGAVVRVDQAAELARRFGLILR